MFLCAFGHANRGHLKVKCLQERQCTYNVTLAHLHKSPKYQIFWQFFIGSHTDTCRQTDGQMNNLILFPYKRAILWWFNVTVNNETYLGLHVKCPTFLPDFNQTWIQANMDFHKRFVWKSPISNFMVICPLGAMLMHVDRQTCWSWWALFVPVWMAPRNIAAGDEVIKERAKVVGKYCAVLLY